MLKLRDGIVELYRKVAISIPYDIEEALRTVCSNETETSVRESLEIILKKVTVARTSSSPICKDTGFPVFFVKVPMGLSHRIIREVIADATRIATKKVPLAPNAINSVTGMNSGDNVGDLFPLVYIDETDEQTLTVDLMLKGGDSENLGQTYSGLGTGDRGLGTYLQFTGPGSRVPGPDFITECVLDAISRARGKGCPPYSIAVAIGGARDQVTYMSKRQLIRKLNDVHPDPALAGLEASILTEIKSFAGQACALGVKIAAAHRPPESYFVDVSFACWAHRRGRLVW